MEARMATATAVIGLCAALLMFSGDMILYFTTEQYELDGTLAPYINIMSHMPAKRLAIGGMLGPIAAFFYCVGFTHIYFLFPPKYMIVAIVLICVFICSSIIGGAYHSHFPYLGLACENKETAQKISVYIMQMMRIAMLPMLAGILVFATFSVLGKTNVPRWFVAFTPLATYFLAFAWRKVPQPFRIVLFGGWYNLMFVIYYIAVLIWAMQQ